MYQVGGSLNVMANKKIAAAGSTLYLLRETGMSQYVYRERK
jgi:hypothetical protein